ncbi:MAG TPA: hypothetical protein VG917_03715 [Patescibacteria group bacterium]|nr:hypothetical protein [Patescibacteria group bacterium]
MANSEKDSYLIPPQVTDDKSKNREVAVGIGLLSPYLGFVSITAVEMGFGGSLEQALMKLGIASAIEATVQLAYRGGLRYLHRPKELTEPEVAQEYVNLFESRFKKMKTLDELPSNRNKPNTDVLGMSESGYKKIVKLTEAVIVGRKRGGQITRYDLLIADAEYSKFNGHTEVYNSNGGFTFDFSSNTTAHGAVFQDERGKRGLVLAAEHQIINKDADEAGRIVDLVVDMLDRYKIDQGFFSYDPRSITLSQTRLTVTKSSNYGDIVRDRQLNEFAQIKGLTNSEYMRFRLSGQLPSEFEDEE